MQLEFSGQIWFWRGPAPWHFVTVPEAASAEIANAAAIVSYGWGMIPVTAEIGRTVWATSLFPKDALYIVPLKAQVRKAESLALGDSVQVRLTLDG
jgi:hypothetical protein